MAQTEKHPHTLCVACATSALTGSAVWVFFEGKKFNKGVKHLEYIKNVDEIKYVTTNLKYVTTSHEKKNSIVALKMANVPPGWRCRRLECPL